MVISKLGLHYQMAMVVYFWHTVGLGLKNQLKCCNSPNNYPSKWIQLISSLHLTKLSSLINLVVMIQLKNWWKWQFGIKSSVRGQSSTRMWLLCACLYSHVLNLWWFLSTIDTSYLRYISFYHIYCDILQNRIKYSNTPVWLIFNRSICSILENLTVT